MARPSATSRSVFLSAPARPFKSARAQPRIVRNSMVLQYRVYRDNSLPVFWGDSPTDTSLITWGNPEQYFIANTDGVTVRVYATFAFPATVGTTYIISFDVEALTGTMANENVMVNGITHDGGTGFNVTTTGRHVFKLKATTGGTATCRLGIGVNGNGPTNASIRIANVMMEIPTDSARTYPYEYIQPGDARVLPFTHANTVSSNIAQTPTLGTPYEYPRRSSVLVVGDSIGMMDWAGTGFLAYWAQKILGHKFAMAARAVSGERMDEITTRLTAALAEVSPHANIARYGVIVLQGGTNDITQGYSFSHMQTQKLAQLDLVRDYGAVPVIVGLPPFNGATAAQQIVMDSYNDWLRTYCVANNIRFYDFYLHAADGSDDYKASWATPDGVHPGLSYNQGCNRMGEQVADLIMTVAD